MQHRESLQYEVHLAQELVDVRHDRVNAAILQISGERPPDPEGIERIRSLAKDLERARETLIDATCRWHYSKFSQKRLRSI